MIVNGICMICGKDYHKEQAAGNPDFADKMPCWDEECPGNWDDAEDDE